jgi:hypothetical protein
MNRKALNNTTDPRLTCTHERLWWSSGGYYILCRDCSAGWVLKQLGNDQPERGISLHLSGDLIRHHEAEQPQKKRSIADLDMRDQHVRGGYTGGPTPDGSTLPAGGSSVMRPSEIPVIDARKSAATTKIDGGSS